MVHGEPQHEPVLVEEVLAFLGRLGPRRYLDLTLGGGGHARTILAAFPEAHLIGVDRDGETLQRTAADLGKEFGDRFRALWARFDQADLKDGEIVAEKFDGVLLDLGLSSLQLDDPMRGFGLMQDGPLDLRMDRSGPRTGADLLRELDEKELADLFYRLGDEHRSRAIARAIMERRRVAPITRTRELADLVARVIGRGGRGKRIHPATRVFQALRIQLNDELGCLERVLPMADRWLKPGGRLAVISFHSGEDRRVKRFLRSCADLLALCKKPVVPGPEEKARNPRCRSARMRVAEKRHPLPQGQGPRSTLTDSQNSGTGADTGRTSLPTADGGRPERPRPVMGLRLASDSD